MYCIDCGTKNPDGARFCMECGMRMPVRDARPAAVDVGPTAESAPHDSPPSAAPRAEEEEASSAKDLILSAFRHFEGGRHEEARALCARAIALEPGYAEAHQKIAETLRQPAEALEHWLEVIRLRPNHAVALRCAAWILATNQSIRNGPEAQALAVRALLVAGSSDAAALDTLAAAYAENGRFEEAIATARRAAAADPSLAQAIQARIERYRSGKPWREPPPN